MISPAAFANLRRIPFVIQWGFWQMREQYTILTIVLIHERKVSL
jgi:hypothetical protein